MSSRGAAPNLEPMPSPPAANRRLGLTPALRDQVVARVRRWLGRDDRPPATLDVILLAGDAHSGRLPGGEVLLDEAALAQPFSSFGQRIGAIPVQMGSRFSQRVAGRLAGRLGRRYAAQLGVAAELLADAWYFPLWAELCNLIPLRHLARRVARAAGGARVLIPLDLDKDRYLSLWERSGLEPFYLAAELRRRQVPVAFVCSAPQVIAAARRGGSFTLRLRPHPVWEAPLAETRPSPHGKEAVVLAGMRGVDTMLSRIDDPFLVSCRFAAPPCGFDAAISDPGFELPTVEITLRCAPLESAVNRIGLDHAADPRRFHLGKWLCEVLGPATRAAADGADRLVQRHGLTAAHVCDHMFFEAAIVSHAVRRRGGRVVLWPHSSNAVHVPAHRPDTIDRIYCLTRSSARTWEASFPHVPRGVVSELMLQPAPGPRPFSPGEPITVVVIAGNHSLNRMPILDYAGHAESYRRLFAGLAAMGPGVQFLCKAKPPWESIDWLRSLAGPDIDLSETLDAPTKIDLPNLVYVSVSFGSTALLEGLGRGIPCMIVREIPVEDYTALDAAHFPVGPVDLVLGQLRQCLDPAVFRSMTEAQLAWYAEETHFGETAPLSRENKPL